MADWAANRLGQVGTPASWPAFGQAVVRRALVPDIGSLEQVPHRGVPWQPLPTIACEGEPQERIDLALQGPTQPPAPGRGWADDQADRVVAAVNAGVWS